MHTQGRKLYREGNLQIVFGVTLIAILGVSSITPAFPKVVRALGISPKSVGLLITAFTLPGVILAPLAGVLADRFGRKRILVPSLFLFGLAGGACAFVRTFGALLVLRFFQGIGAAPLGVLNVTIIGDLYSGRERTAAMGYNASVLSVGTASYPAIGGAIALLGWNWPFLLALLAIPTGLLVALGLKNPEPQRRQEWGHYFAAVWRRVKDRRVIALFFASIATFVVLYGAYLTYFPLFLGNDFGASSALIGLLMSSMSLSTAVTSSQLGKLTHIFSERMLVRMGFSLYALALAIMPFVPTLWLFLIPTVLFGVGHGMNIPSIMSLLAGYAPLEQRAAFMSLNGMVLRIGQTIGPPVIGIAFGVWGMSGAFFCGAVLAGVAACAFLFVL